MAIVTSGGKVLKLNNQTLEISGGVSKSWLLNDVLGNPPPTTTESVMYHILFTCPESTITYQLNYIKFYIIDKTDYQLTYGDTSRPRDEFVAYNQAFQEWNTEYGNLKYIEFAEVPTGDLLTWLQANGTPQ